MYVHHKDVLMLSISVYISQGITADLPQPLVHDNHQLLMSEGLSKAVHNTEGRTFIDNHMRWSEQGLLWGIDSGDYSHYSTFLVLCSRTQLDSSLSWVLRVLIFV